MSLRGESRESVVDVRVEQRRNQETNLWKDRETSTGLKELTLR